MSNLELEQVKQIIERLSPDEKASLTKWLNESAETESTQPKPRRSLLGLWEGVHVTDEDIEEARREMWKNFPRDDY